MEKVFWTICTLLAALAVSYLIKRALLPSGSFTAEQTPRIETNAKEVACDSIMAKQAEAYKAAEKLFKPRIYTKVIYNEIQDAFNVYVLAAMYPHEAAIAQSFVDSDGMIAYHVGSWPKFLEEVSCKTAAEALKEKHRLQKEAQKYIDKTIKRKQEVADSLDYIRNN